MTGSAISVSGLRKSGPDGAGLEGVAFDVPAGTVFALLGAGRTTTVDILTAEVAADGGTVRVAGFDPATEPERVRAAVARASAGELPLADRSRILFLDEPTAGLDPRHRRTVWSAIGALAARGVTVFLTTRHFEEAERLADRIAVLDRGRLVAQGVPGELTPHVRLRFGTAAEFEEAARVLTDAIRDDDALALRVPGGGNPESLRNLKDRLGEYSLEAESCTVQLMNRA